MHLWLGLISGIVVFLVSSSGCVLVFQDEIKDLLYSYRKISIEERPILAPSLLLKQALKRYPQASVSRFILFKKGRPATILVKNGSANFYVYINPYSGKTLHHESMTDDFFLTVQHLHTHLLLSRPVGSQVVGISVLVFVVMLVTGLFLWWPRKNQRKQSYRIRWGSRWRRLNYDLHKVPGFYTMLVSLIIALTGLSMSYAWVRKVLTRTVNVGKVYTVDAEKFPQSDTAFTAHLSPDSILNKSYNTVLGLSPASGMFITFMPAQKTGVFSISGYATQLHYYKRNDFYFDQYTGKLLKKQYHIDRNPGAKLSSMNYDLHTGQLLGLTGKILAFIACLASASLPVTGFLIWWGKHRRRKRFRHTNLTVTLNRS